MRYAGPSKHETPATLGRRGSYAGHRSCNGLLLLADLGLVLDEVRLDQLLRRVLAVELLQLRMLDHPSGIFTRR
jgi:hypothetical protein